MIIGNNSIKVEVKTGILVYIGPLEYTKGCNRDYIIMG